MTLGNDTLCNGGQAEIYFLSKKCLESRDAFDTYDCKPKVSGRKDIYHCMSISDKISHVGVYDMI